MQKSRQKSEPKQKFIERPWIQNVLLSENIEKPVPKKVKARVTLLDREENQDGTHSGEITDYVSSINVVFSREAVLRTINDDAHGHTFERFSDIFGGAIVLTDYKVMPSFQKWEFIISINNFKVMPGFIGPLAYTEKIPNHIRKSKHLKGVKDRLFSLWANAYAEGYQSLEDVQIIDARKSDLSKKNSRVISRDNLSYFVEISDEVLMEHEEREELIELFHKYELLEGTSDLEVRDLLDLIHIAHTKYNTFSPELQSFSGESDEAMQISVSDVGHQRTPAIKCQLHEEMMTLQIDPDDPQISSMDMNFTNINKTEVLELCENYGTLQNTEELEMSDLFKMLHQAHVKYAPICDP